MSYGSHIIEEFRKLAIARLMPDTCIIVSNDVTTVMNPLGYREEATEYTYRQYNGSNDIPCRFDSVTSYRPDKATYQVTDIDEFMVVLPYSMADVIQVGDKLHYDGYVYEIRQLTQGTSNYEGVTEIRVHRNGISEYTPPVADPYYPQVVADLGYSVWDWDASNTATLFQDSLANTPVTTDSQPVGAWRDGVQNVDAIQATTSAKPTYATGTLNGLPTLSFDGSDMLSTGNISISTFAVWVVVRYTAGAIIYEQGTAIESVDGMFLSNTGYRVRRSTNYSTYSATVLTNGQTKLLRHENQGTHATHKLFSNNSAVSGTSGTSGNPGTATATQPLFIGARSGVQFPMTGNIAELVIVSPYPTAEIIASMETYINSKWAVY